MNRFFYGDRCGVKFFSVDESKAGERTKAEK